MQMITKETGSGLVLERGNGKGEAGLSAYT
jgi:hypothetical protein